MNISDIKLGCLWHEPDPRTLKLMTVLKNLPPNPDVYDYEATHPTFPARMFANDKYGDCTIAGSANLTLAYEYFEQGKYIDISDKDVTDRYFQLSHGKDTGLNPMTVYRNWRLHGWTIGGKNYKIAAFGEVNPQDKEEVKSVINLLNGAGLCLMLPISAQKQIGAIWDVDNSPNGAVGSWGGHFVAALSYTPDYITCRTWGTTQKLTWAFLAKYANAVFGAVDNRDGFVKNDTLNVSLLESYLKQISS